MKRSKYIVLFSMVFLAATALSIAVASCSNPSEYNGKTSFTINLGDTGRMAEKPGGTSGSAFPTYSDLTFSLNFISTNGPKSHFFGGTWPANGKIQGEIDAGEYTVSLNISLKADGSLYASDDGEHSSVTIKPDVNTTISMHMVKDPNVEGDGSEANPFRVYDEATLRKVGTETGAGTWNLSAHYRQVADITFPSGSAWTPIGTDPDPFTGSYDGNEKIISSLKIDDPTAEFQGLFGFIGNGATVQNVGIVNCDIKGGERVGGVVGKNNGTVENCYVTGNVSGTNYIGGVLGGNWGTVQNCYATGNVSGTNYVGGVVGYNVSSLRNCYATGVVSGDQYVGGVAGSSSGTLQNCVALSPNVSATSLFGRVVGLYTGPLTNNYGRSGMAPGGWANIGDADSDGAEVADGLYNSQAWWITTSGLGWNFSTVWEWGGSLPKLQGVRGQ